MPGGGLFDPLGVDHIEPRRPPFRPSAPMLVVALCAAVISILVAVAWIRDDGDRGEPRAVSPIVRMQAPVKPSVPPTPPAAPSLPPPAADQDVEIQNGVRIIRPRRERSMPQGQTVPASGEPARAP